MIKSSGIRKQIAEQVAHDIRSPLAAINTALSDVTSISENKRIMIRSAAKRINDIANNILSQSKHNSSELGSNDLDRNILPELIFVVLDNIVSEKRYEYHNSKIDIQLKVSPCCYSSFSNINLVSFKRVLSNLINNSMTWSSKLTHLVKPLFSRPTISLQIDSDSHNQDMNASDTSYKTSKCNLKHLVELRSAFGIGTIAHVLV